MFFNKHHAKLSRGGIAWILSKYQTQSADPTLTDVQLSPHILRHSRAMHLYDVGVPLPYIRDILGHVHLSTTEIYGAPRPRRNAKHSKPSTTRSSAPS